MKVLKWIESFIREIWRFTSCKVMNYLKISARNTSSFASIRPFGLVSIAFNWDCPLWRPLAHINDTNLYVNFENSGRAHSWALRPPHLGSLISVSLTDFCWLFHKLQLMADDDQTLLSQTRGSWQLLLLMFLLCFTLHWSHNGLWTYMKMYPFALLLPFLQIITKWSSVIIKKQENSYLPDGIIISFRDYSIIISEPTTSIKPEDLGFL